MTKINPFLFLSINEPKTKSRPYFPESKTKLIPSDIFSIIIIPKENFMQMNAMKN